MQLSTINIFQATRIEGTTVNSVTAGKGQFSRTSLELDKDLMAVIVTQSNGEKIGIPLGNIYSFTVKPDSQPITKADNGSEDKAPITGASEARKQKARTA